MTGVSLFGDDFDSLLAAAKARAGWAWERIYDALAPKIIGYAAGRGAHDAEEVCGEVFFQLVRDINRFEGDERGFRSWVFVIAHHRMLDAARKSSRTATATFVAEELAAIEDPQDVEQDVLRRRREADLREMLDAVTPDQRDVLLLRIFGGLTIDEIARVIGRRPGAIKALQRRGLETLKKMIDESGYPFGDEER